MSDYATHEAVVEDKLGQIVTGIDETKVMLGDILEALGNIYSLLDERCPVYEDDVDDEQ